MYEMSVEMKPIGYVSTDADKIPRSWDVSDIEGALVFDESYVEGLSAMLTTRSLSTTLCRYSAKRSILYSSYYYLPLKMGSLFSKKALAASLKSSVPIK